MGLLQRIFGGGSSAVKEAIAKGATIIDVRTPQEFAGGHPKGAMNIPLTAISSNISRIKKLRKPLVLCCASGMRSGQATTLLKKEGIEEVYNGGSWTNI